MKTSKLDKLRTIDLFSGCGGLTEGFEMSGLFSTIGAVEWDKPSLDTLVNRLQKKWGYADAKSLAFHFDMQRTEQLMEGWNNDREYGSGEGLKKLVKKGGGDVDLVVGGPPCQAYSIAGRIRDTNGMRNDYRNYLFETYLEVVREFKPKAFVFENVLGMLSAKPDGILITELIKKAFHGIGYEIIEDLKDAAVDASDYGVPQYRKRLVIVGLSRRFFGADAQSILADFYFNILPSHKAKRQTVADALSDLPKMKVVHGKNNSHEVIGASSIKNHVPRYHSPRDIEIFKELARDLQRKNRKYGSVEDLKKLYTQKTGKTSSVHKYYVLHPDQPSNTIVAHLHKDGLRHIHPDPTQARSITVREAARLQSFPDDFEFLGSMGDQYKMIGNAVPPLLAKAVALSIGEILEKYRKTEKAPIMSFYEHGIAKV
ncbi:MAG TPA: DNA cytosine methyltransferase [Candidatus Paceibacterota bacterium]|nr:DNA cytosine methyltransferase [Candidatus Paceibacterota bacterium]